MKPIEETFSGGTRCQTEGGFVVFSCVQMDTGSGKKKLDELFSEHSIEWHRYFFYVTCVLFA